MHRARPSSPESRSRERASSERYPRAHASHQRPSHKPDSRKCRYSERYSRERSPSRARRDWRDRSRSPCRDNERACCACVGSPVHEDPAGVISLLRACPKFTCVL